MLSVVSLIVAANNSNQYMRWVRNHPFVTSLGVLLVSSSLLAVVSGYIGLVVFSALVSGGSVIPVVVNLAFPYFLIIAVLVTLMIVSGISFAWSLLRRLSLPRGGRLHTIAEYGEQKSSILDTLNLSAFVAPPAQPAEERAADVIAALKQQYVNGDIDEYEFEQTMDSLVANDSVDAARAVQEYDRELNSRSG